MVFKDAPRSANTQTISTCKQSVNREITEGRKIFSTLCERHHPAYKMSMIKHKSFVFKLYLTWTWTDFRTEISAVLVFVG